MLSVLVSFILSSIGAFAAGLPNSLVCYENPGAHIIEIRILDPEISPGKMSLVYPNNYSFVHVMRWETLPLRQEMASADETVVFKGYFARDYSWGKLDSLGVDVIAKLDEANNIIEWRAVNYFQFLFFDRNGHLDCFEQ